MRWEDRGFLLCGAILVTMSGCAQHPGPAFHLAEYNTFKSAPVSFSDAIVLVETTEGGDAVSAEFEIENGLPAYEIEVVLPDRSIRSVIVDVRTRKVLRTEIEDEIDSPLFGTNLRLPDG